MRNFIRPSKNQPRNQRGFTLVELVVVLGIMAALAAVVVPVVARFAGRGDEEANDTEKQTVQSAIDLYMSDQALTLVTASGTSTTVWSAVDLGAGVNVSPGYMRQSATKCGYTWDASGAILVQTCP